MGQLVTILDANFKEGGQLGQHRTQNVLQIFLPIKAPLRRALKINCSPKTSLRGDRTRLGLYVNPTLVDHIQLGSWLVSDVNVIS